MEIRISVLKNPVRDYAWSSKTTIADLAVEIILCVEGYAEIVDTQVNKKTPLQKGISVIISALVKEYNVVLGNATCYKATVPV